MRDPRCGVTIAPGTALTRGTFTPEHTMPRAPLLVIALALVGALEARGQDTQPASPSREKSATAARIIGIIPGAGHMYAGEPGRGFAYMGGTLGILLVGSVAVATDCVAEGIAGS